MLDIQKEAEEVAAKAEVRTIIHEAMRDLFFEHLRFDQAKFTAMDRTAYVAATACLAVLDLYWDYYADGLITLEDILRWTDEALTAVISSLQ